MGDFNGDGRPDVRVTYISPQISLSLLTGKGDSTFNAPVHFPPPVSTRLPSSRSTSIRCRLDIVVAPGFGCFVVSCIVGRTISVLLGNGDGTFQPSREIDIGIGMSEIAVCDFNRDGRKDLAIGGDSSRVCLLVGVGDGTFTQQTLTLADINLGMDATDISTADFNRDTIDDLAVALSLNGSKTAILIATATALSSPRWPAKADGADAALSHRQRDTGATCQRRLERRRQRDQLRDPRGRFLDHRCPL